MEDELKTIGVGVVSSAAAVAAYEAWRRSTEKEIVMGRPARLMKIDPGSVGFDADTFQFKSGGDDRGVTDRLKGVKSWDAVAAGKAVVYEYADGRRVIADGHQRLGLAKRLSSDGQQVRMDAYVMRERDGWSPRDVRVYAAIKNMKELSGQSLDMAKVMRERPDLVDSSIPMSDSKIREAKALANLSDDAFKKVAAGAVKPEVAAAVGEAIKDSSRHADMLDELTKSKVTSAQHARLYVGQAMAAPSIMETTSSLFGDETQVRSLVKERAQVLDKAITALKQDKRIFALLEREAGTIESAGNKLAHDVNAARATESGHTAALVEKLATTRGPLSSMLDRAAEAVAKGEKVQKAARAFTKEVGSMLKSGGLKALAGDAVVQTSSRMQAMTGKDSLADLMRETRERYDAAEKLIREELAKPNPSMVKRQDNGLTMQLTKAPYGDGDFRITRYMNGEPIGHSDYKADARGIREAAYEMAPSPGEKPKGRLQAMIGTPFNKKGAVGKFEYGYNPEGKQDWQVRNKDTGEVIARARNQSEAFKAAERANGGIGGKTQTSFLPDASTKEQIAAAMKGKGKPAVPQKDIGGMFGDDAKQMDLVDESRKLAAKNPVLDDWKAGKITDIDAIADSMKAANAAYKDHGSGSAQDRQAVANLDEVDKAIRAKHGMEPHWSQKSKENLGWSDEARAVSAEARAAVGSTVTTKTPLIDLPEGSTGRVVAIDDAQFKAGLSDSRMITVEFGKGKKKQTRIWNDSHLDGKFAAVVAEEPKPAAWSKSMSAVAKPKPKEAPKAGPSRLEQAISARNPGWSDAARDASAEARAVSPAEQARRQKAADVFKNVKAPTEKLSRKEKAELKASQKARIAKAKAQIADMDGPVVVEKAVPHKGTPIPPRPVLAELSPEDIAKGESRWVNRMRAIDGAPGKTDAQLKAEYRSKMGIAEPAPAASKRVAEIAQRYASALKGSDAELAGVKATIEQSKLSKAEVHELAKLTGTPVSKSMSGKAVAKKLTGRLGNLQVSLAKTAATAGRIAGSVLGPAAIGGAAYVAFDSTMNSANAAGDKDATSQAVVAAAKAGGVVAAATYGIAKGMKAAARVFPKIAPALGPIGIAAMAGSLAYWSGSAAVEGYKKDGFKGALKGAGRGTLDWATFGAASYAIDKNSAPAHSPRLTSEQATKFKDASANYDAMKSASTEKRSTSNLQGFANPTVQKAAQVGRGVVNVSGWAATAPEPKPKSRAAN